MAFSPERNIMAKIIKVTATPSVNNQVKTSRNSATNPFKYSNFDFEFPSRYIDYDETMPVNNTDSQIIVDEC